MISEIIISIWIIPKFVCTILTKLLNALNNCISNIVVQYYFPSSLNQWSEVIEEVIHLKPWITFVSWIWGALFFAFALHKVHLIFKPSINSLRSIVHTYTPRIITLKRGYSLSWTIVIRIFLICWKKFDCLQCTNASVVYAHLKRSIAWHWDLIVGERSVGCLGGLTCWSKLALCRK